MRGFTNAKMLDQLHGTFLNKKKPINVGLTGWYLCKVKMKSMIKNIMLLWYETQEKHDLQQPFLEA